MRTFALLACGFVAACNYDTGECYLRGQDGAGVGGGAITPTGAGGFGDVPPEPQGAPAPVDPCLQKAECTVTWKADSDVCKGRGTTGTCTSYYQGNHSTLSEAQSECERISGVGNGSGAESCGSCHWVTNATNDCYDKCDAIADKEREKCQKMEPGAGRAKCNQAVEEQRTACYADCNKK